MINGVNNFGPVQVASGGAAAPAPAGPGSGGASFADALKNSIDEVSRLQQDASKAVEDLATGKKDDVTGVMTAMEKSDLAFNDVPNARPACDPTLSQNSFALVVVTNNGPIASGPVRMTDHTPIDMTFVSVSQSMWPAFT